MSDYLAADPSMFDGFRRQNVSTLLTLVSSLVLPSIEYVRRRYSEHATDFDTTVRCLVAAGLIREEGEQLRLGQQLADEAGLQLTGDSILTAILKQPSVTAPVYDYLRRFRSENGRIALKLNSQDPCIAVRDFLMDFDMLTYDRDAQEYLVDVRFWQTFALAHRRSQTLSPFKLDHLLEQKQGIGVEAELAVVQYEKDRVGGGYACRVQHTASEDTLAGYDVESVSVEEQGVLPRYIEVKAVSAGNFGFYWTTNEIRMARVLRHLYFLYLVPVVGGEVCLTQLRAICDPCDQVLRPDGLWDVEESVLHCQLSMLTQDLHGDA